MNATTRWRGSAIAQRVVVAAIATALLLTGTAGPATSATPTTYTATKSWTQSESVTAQEWATVGTFVGYGTATVTESATATRTYTAGAAWEADYWATWNAYLAASEEARAKAEAKARPLAKAQATAQAQAQYDESLKGYDATKTWTATETVKVDETHTIGDVVGHGSATATSTATATGSAHAATQAEADWWATWNAYVAALLQAQAQADAQARPIAKAKAKADAEAQVAAGIEATESWTSTETVTVNETATVGDFVGHGTATSTKTVTATKTVKAATHWEAYYWAVIQASVDASAQAKAQADAAARAEALAIAQADAQAQYDAAQVPIDPEEPGGGGPTGPDCGTAPLKADGTPWTCTFVDEFRGTELDQTKWHPIDTYESEFSYGDCFFGDRNIEVSSGVLKLSTIREDQPVTCDHPAGAITTDYTSAAVTTFSKFSQSYGRYEIRAAMPQSNGPGLQSALWMLPENPKYGEWPGSGEIDIVEFYSQYPDRLVPALHYNSLLPWGTRTNNNCLVYEPTAFHTYVLEWTPSKLTISIDGTTCLDHTISPLAPLIGSAPFDQPFNLNLTQMLGSGDNAFPEGQGIDEATLQVDYVRVWK
ncbi:glycoside hydrolase family 16 protein [Aeromicrobium alkaliterrae]